MLASRILFVCALASTLGVSTAAPVREDADLMAPGVTDGPVWFPGTILEGIESGAPSGHYLDGTTDEVFHYDSTTRTLTPAPGIEPQGLYDVDVVPPGQKPSIVTRRTETCPTTKTYCIAMGFALVGGNRVLITRVHTDVCWPTPFQHDSNYAAALPVMEASTWEAAGGGCCGTIFARMYIQDRLRDSDSMGWRSSFGCP